ncbi:MAG: toxin glutamine deamidase domain-containing protein, partial [Alistipes sp.]
GKRYREFFEETCRDEGIYELSIGWERGGGHATILQRFDNGELRYIEPQVDNSQGSGRESRNIDYLCKAGATRMHNCRGVMRIDNKIFNLDYADIFDK